MTDWLPFVTQKAKEYVDEVFSHHEETDRLPAVLEGRTVFHLYPVADTMHGDELEGYRDALFFDVHVYMCDDEKKYVIECRDEIGFQVPCRVRIFKDASTMITVDGAITMDTFQAMTIRPVKEAR